MRVGLLWCAAICFGEAACYSPGVFPLCDGAQCDTPPSDGPPVDVPEGCILTKYLDVVCPSAMPADRTLNEIIETSTCNVGMKVMNSCVVFARSLQVNQVRAVGGLPLVLISDTTIVIDGLIDVGSGTENAGAAANVGCPDPGKPGTDGQDVVQQTFGGGGGGGGSYQLSGGRGGLGEMTGGNSAGGGGPGAPQAPGLRGGCRGGDGGATGTIDGGKGTGGDGGGAVYLVARESIAFANASRIVAGGAGGGPGDQAAGGGGGGGSGGSILLEAPRLLVTGNPPTICANGGGGGGGAENNMKAAEGAHACFSGINAAIGGNGPAQGVAGGNGGAGSTLLGQGDSGDGGDDGGGGGGGGPGFVEVIGAPGTDIGELGTNVSPPAVQ